MKNTLTLILSLQPSFPTVGARTHSRTPECVHSAGKVYPTLLEAPQFPNFRGVKNLAVRLSSPPFRIIEVIHNVLD